MHLNRPLSVNAVPIISDSFILLESLDELEPPRYVLQEDDFKILLEEP